MAFAFHAALLLTLCGAIGLLTYWLTADVRILRTLRSLPTPRDGLPGAEREPPADRVCVITPAHNEESSIARHVTSLRAQRYAGDVRFVLALDRCTDGTERVVRELVEGDERFEIIHVEACPDDWAGKVNAIWTAVCRSEAAASADVLVFTDADTEFDPDLLRATVAISRQRGLEMLSLWSTLRVERWYEWLVQPACGIELMYEYPLLRANRREGRRAFANGQFILFDAAAYQRIGGHASVNRAILEDMALARLAAEHGLEAGALFDDGMLHVRMYPEWRAFRNGWKRIFIDCAKRKVGRMRGAASRLLLTHAALPASALGCFGLSVFGGGLGPAWVRFGAMGISGLALVAWLGTLGYIYARARYPIWAALAHPIGACVVARMMREGAADLEAGRPVVWGGRRYVLEPR